MSLAVFDIGGTAVKYGYWQEGTLSRQSSFPTPASFEEMVAAMKDVIAEFGDVSGVGISAPGAVDVAKRQIDGISAVPYIHFRPIYDELEAAFGLPVTIENDANCAGISEIESGAGKDAQHAVFVVLGTGVGGAIFINRQIYKGAHLFGGEFGMMKSYGELTLSWNGTVVRMADNYQKQTGEAIDGKELFARQEAGDPVAVGLIDGMYQAIARSLYNIQVSIDPEVIIIGGGISARPDVIEELKKRVQALLDELEVGQIMPEIKACVYLNDANLIGAAVNFENLSK